MNLEFILVPIGIALIVVPTVVVCGAKMRERLAQPARRHNEGLGSLVRCPMNWIDLLRGAAGAWLVQKPFQDTVSAQDELAPTLILVQLGILLVGVLAQTLWLRRPVRVIGPVFFLAGLTLALCGVRTGGFALALGFSCALMFGRLSPVFSIVPLALVGFGFLFNELDVMTAFNSAAFALPAFIAFTSDTRMSFVRRVSEVPGRSVRAIRAQQPAAPPDAGNVIRPDFAHPPVPAPKRAPDAATTATPVPVPTPTAAMGASAARKSNGDLAKLPDFLRIAEEPDPHQKRARKRLFPLRGT